mmetsp:Transcript_31885/g.95457  ORF Transcript_31885/g.95457 Transcript_31885/m.95457 type:complete len:446 (-) Transcript_31885:3477-4814(-)
MSKRSPSWERYVGQLHKQRLSDRRNNIDSCCKSVVMRIAGDPARQSMDANDFVLLRSLPPDLLHTHVFGFINLNDLLSVSAASKDMHEAAGNSHFLFMQTGHDDDGNISSGHFSPPGAMPVFIGGEFSPAGADAAAALTFDRFGDSGGARQGPPRSAERPVRSRENDIDSTGRLLFRAPGGMPLWRPQQQGPTISGSMSESKLLAILGRFRSLRSLELKGLTELSDSCLPILNKCHAAPSLVSLSLQDVRIVRDRHRLDLHGNGLEHIKVMGVLFVSYKGVVRHFTSSQNIQSVVLGGCRLLVDGDIEDMVSRASAKLKALCLPGCSKVSMPVIQSETLETLKMHRCLSLQALPRFKCPRLLELDLSFNTSFLDEAVQTVVSSSPLRQLSLRGCSRLKNLQVCSPTLMRLDFSLCNQLKSVNVKCRQLELFEVSSSCFYFRWEAL